MKKNPVCETVVWPLVDRVKNLIEKKWPGLSDSGMASGGLKNGQMNPRNSFLQFPQKILLFSEKIV